MPGWLQWLVCVALVVFIVLTAGFAELARKNGELAEEWRDRWRKTDKEFADFRKGWWEQS